MAEKSNFTNNAAAANIGQRLQINTQVNNFNSKTTLEDSDHLRASTSIFSTLPNLHLHSADFFGRKEQVKQIEIEFQSHNTVILTGVTGIGKSHLAWRFANRPHDVSVPEYLRRAHRFWVSACCYQHFHQSYDRIASEACIKNEYRDGSGLLLAVHKWLKSPASGSWILILDDAVCGALWRSYGDPRGKEAADAHAVPPIADYIPEPSNSKDDSPRLILITTQDNRVVSEINSEKVTGIEIRELEMEACQHLLSSSRAFNDAPGDVTAVAKRLGQHPAAIVSAAAFIRFSAYNQKHFGVVNYLNRIRQEGTWNTLDDHDTRANQLSKHKTKLHEPWIVTLDAIWEINPQAIEVFALMCCFKRSCIPDELITGAYRGDRHADKAKIQSHLRLLSSYRLIEFSTDEATANDGESCRRITRLVLLAGRNWLWGMMPTPRLGCGFHDLHQKAICAVNRHYKMLCKNAGDKISEKRKITHQILPYLHIIQDYCRKTRQLPKEKRLEPRVVAGLVSMAGLYTEVGRYDSAGILLNFAKNHCTPEDRWIVVTLRDFADTIFHYDAQPSEQDLILSGELLKTAISMSRRLGEEELEIEVSSSLPPILLRQGHATEALDRQNRLIELVESKYGKEDIRYSLQKLKRGRLQHERDKIEKHLRSAKKDTEDALTYLTKAPFVTNDEHRRFWILEAKALLAKIYHDLNEIENACQLIDEVYCGRKEVLGANDIKTLNSGIDFAHYLLTNKNPERAESLLEEIKERVITTVGKRHNCKKRCERVLQLAKDARGKTQHKEMCHSALFDLQESMLGVEKEASHH